MTLIYVELKDSANDRRKKGSVARLAWDFGVTAHTVDYTYQRIRHGKTVFRKERLYNDKIMYTLENHLALIDVVVDCKGHISKRRMVHKFFLKTYLKVECNTLVRHLKSLKAEVARRRYCPQLT